MPGEERPRFACNPIERSCENTMPISAWVTRRECGLARNLSTYSEESGAWGLIVKQESPACQISEINMILGAALKGL